MKVVYFLTILVALVVSSSRALKAEAPPTFDCLLCKQVVENIEEELAANSSEAATKHVMLTICEWTGPGVEEPCTAFVNKYFDIIYRLLVNESVDRNKVCQVIGVCDSLLDTRDQPRPLPTKKAAAPSPITCEVCKKVAKELMMESNVLKDPVSVCLKIGFCTSDENVLKRSHAHLKMISEET